MLLQRAFFLVLFSLKLVKPQKITTEAQSEIDDHLQCKCGIDASLEDPFKDRPEILESSQYYHYDNLDISKHAEAVTSFDEIIKNQLQAYNQCTNPQSWPSKLLQLPFSQSQNYKVLFYKADTSCIAQDEETVRNIHDYCIVMSVTQNNDSPVCCSKKFCKAFDDIKL